MMIQAFRCASFVSLAVFSLSVHPARGENAPAGGLRISLAEARERALASSPELEAAVSETAAAAGTLRQARAWANPEVEVEAEGVGGDQPGWDEAEVTWTLGQRLELFGTRSARTRAALHGREAAALSAEATRWDLLAEVERRFAGVLVAQSRIAALEASDSLAVESVRAVTALVEAGEVSPIEVDRAEAERALVSIRLRAARLEHAGALRSLSQLWGSSEPDFSGVRGTLEISPPMPDLDSLRSVAAAIPDLWRADAEVRRAEAEASLAGRSRLPEIAVRGGLKRFHVSNEQSYVGGIGMSMPLFDRGGGGVDLARALLGKARAERTAVRSRIGLDLAGAHDALATALETSRSFREEGLPRAQAVHASIQEGYRRGKFGLLDLIDARRFLLQVRLEYVDALRSVWSARADLARLVGPAAIPDEGVTP
jgi:cobalt-zinc-cadmium efflux system outer membrane protein